jgi:maltooligosyltrehalose trehalohydrolase
VTADLSWRQGRDPSSNRGDHSGPRVWAPRAGSVGLHHGDDVTPMSAQPGGWWTAPVRLPHGTDYSFSLDGRDPRPDPRSRWQPSGVHAASRVFDPTLHRWTDTGWAGRDVRGAVIYELHVGTFTDAGTLDGAVERLGHLVDLGVDVVELMPVAAFPGVHGWGYDGVCLFAVHEPYGGPAALQRFVDAAHAHGLAVCLDVVYNHLGPSGNYLSEFGPYFTGRHRTPWGDAIDLDGPDAAEVRAFILDNAVQWLRDFHVDALRLDAVHALLDESERHLLADLSDRVTELAEEVGRPLSLIAESDLNDAAMVAPTSQGGMGMTAQWADDVHHAVHALLTGERHGYYVDFGSVEALEKALTGVFVHDGGWSTFRGQPWGRPVPPGTDGHRFVAFASDHDQVGNRALGDRPSERLDAGGLAIAAALVLTSPFTPMIFMGEEWGARSRWQFFTDHSEPDLVESIRRGRAAEFGSHGWSDLYGGPVEVPDPQAPSTVETSRLRWSETGDEDHRRLLEWYRALIRLRRAEHDLLSGDLTRTDVHAARPDIVVVRRGDLRVVVSLADEPREVALDAGPADVLLAWEPTTVTGATVGMAARSVAVLSLGAKGSSTPG